MKFLITGTFSDDFFSEKKRYKIETMKDGRYNNLVKYRLLPYRA